MAHNMASHGFSSRVHQSVFGITEMGSQYTSITVFFPVGLTGTKTMASVRWTIYTASTQCKDP